MLKNTIVLGGLGVTTGTLIGSHIESCQEGNCWEATPYERPAECSSYPVSLDCVLTEIAADLRDASTIVTDNTDGASIGASCGLIAGLVLSILANRMKRKPVRRV